MITPRPASRRTDTIVVLFALVYPSVLTWVYFVAAADWPAGTQRGTYVAGKCIQFALPLVWFLAARPARLSWRWPRWRELAENAIFGIVVFAAIVVSYETWLGPRGYLASAGELIGQRVVRFGIDSLPKWIAMGVFYSLVHSLLEEYYWRWFVFGRLRDLVCSAGFSLSREIIDTSRAEARTTNKLRFLAIALAILISAAGFTAHHVIVLAHYFGLFSAGALPRVVMVPRIGLPAALVFSLGVFIGGAVWAWFYHRYGSLWGIWLSHLLVDAAIFVVGYDLARSHVG